MMVCLLLYAYCVGVFSSRKIALACERNLAFMAIVGEGRPDFRTISDFRKWLILDSRVVIGQVWRNRLFLQAFNGGRDRCGVFGKSRLISSA
jgi:transposase